MAASWTDSWWSVDKNKWSWSSDVHDKWSWSASEVDENQWSWSASEVDENELNQRWMAEVCTRLEKSDQTDEPSPGLKTAQGICQNTKVENGRRGVKNGQKK